MTNTGVTSKAFIYMIFVFFIGACQKNTNELPPYYVTGPFQKDATYNNSPYIRVHFNENVPAGRGQISATFENLSGSTLANIKLLVEVCSGNPSFQNCQYPGNVTTINSLAAGEKSKFYTFYTTGNFNLDSKYVSVYLLGLTGTNNVNVLSGYYYQGTSTHQASFTDSVANTVGIIAADGNLVLRLDKHYMNILGRFNDTLLTYATVYDTLGNAIFNTYNDTIVQYHYVDSTVANHLNFKLGLIPLPNSSFNDTSIKIKLLKQ